MRDKGITLVTLVVTIIIFILLASISIHLLLDKHGLLPKAKEASRNYEEARVKELGDLEQLYSSIMIATEGDSQITISMQDLNTLIEEKVKEYSTEPIGSVISYMGNHAPNGYLPCDGSIFPIKEYPNLAEQMKKEFGTYHYFGGDGTETFAVPNLSGEFLRGAGTQGYGTAAAIGKHQNATWHPMVGTAYNSASDYWIGGFAPGFGTSTDREQDMNKGNATCIVYSRGETNKSYAGNPTQYTSRPTNTTVLYCIKY